MATIRKLSAFRQLSLNCETPEARRRSLKKQFSEDFSEIGGKTRDRPPLPIKIAWAEPKEEAVIVKKCKEIKRPQVPKLTRHGSLENDSILYSKQELADRLREALKERKPNLNIFLAHNTREIEDNNDNFQEFPEAESVQKIPKMIQPLFTPAAADSSNVFQIRKNKETTKPNNAVVVVPIIERNEDNDPKPIDIIIRPSTAAAKRERFQKRTNSAFNSIIKDEKPPRPVLTRSSSAPSRPEAKPKFLATRRKIKSGKRKEAKSNVSDEEGSNKENPKSRKEMNRYVPVNGSDIVTMVSLISPAASDGEEVTEAEKVKAKKCGSPAKSGAVKREDKDGPKNVSLRKTVKSVSFQQSSIHAIRSFSASFPARRGSMATALMLGNAAVKSGNQKSQVQEKRATATSDEDERGPKRRLVRSSTADHPPKSIEDPSVLVSSSTAQDLSSDANISVAIKTKTPKLHDDQKTGVDALPVQLSSSDENAAAAPSEAEDDKEPKFGSLKEKQCWEMYCKMTEKGISVAYDTILRGMLTPTEYRMRRKEIAVEIPGGDGITNGITDSARQS